MKTLVLSAVTALVLAGAAQAQPLGSGQLAVKAPDVTAPSNISRPPQVSVRVQMADPTGIPSYELRPDGLLINGLLPANGWQG